MSKLIQCPYCKDYLDTENDEPEAVSNGVNVDGQKAIYVMHKVICHNVDKHPMHNEIVVVFKPGEENE